METYYRRETCERPARRRINTARAMLYFFLSFVLSLIFFVLVVTLLSVGLGTIIIWVGIPILLIAFAMIRGIASIERSMLRHLLATDLAEPYPQKTDKGWWKATAAYLRDSSTWKYLLYILIKFPFSMVMFWIAFAFWISAIATILFPVAYLVITQLDPGWGLYPHFTLIPGSGLLSLYITSVFDLSTFIRILCYVPAGLLLLVLAYFMVRGFGWLMAELGRVFLSPAHATSSVMREESRIYLYQ